MPLMLFHWPDQSGSLDISCARAPQAIPVAAKAIAPSKIRFSIIVSPVIATRAHTARAPFAQGYTKSVGARKGLAAEIGGCAFGIRCNPRPGSRRKKA
jgi:hypothetical protein